MNNCQRFESLYKNNTHKGGCHGPGKLGDEYVCPTIGEASPARSMPGQNPACNEHADNMGKLAYCMSAQAGGGAADSRGLVFTATGQLEKSKKPCGCQKGGSEDAVAATATHTQGTPVTGFFIDVSAPKIGGQPVRGTHDNVLMDTTYTQSEHFMDRKFDCRQPSWEPNCL
jgi:hypothetical protein